jgi:hypothetical protein
MEEATKEFIGRKAESTLKERGQHHNFLSIGCWDVFPFFRPLMKHNTAGEKVVVD